MKLIQKCKTTCKVLYGAFITFAITPAMAAYAAGPSDLTAAGNDTKTLLATVAKVLGVVGMASFSTVGIAKYLKMQHADNDSDYHAAKKSLTYLVYGFVGSLIVTAAATTISSAYK